MNIVNRLFSLFGVLALAMFLGGPWAITTLVHGEACHGIIRLTDTSGAPVDVMISQISQISKPIRGIYAPSARAVVEKGNGKEQAVRESQDDVSALLTACKE